MEGGFLKEVVSLLKNINSLVVITGAGISAESGIPTFRGKDGLWKNFRAEELATPQAFRKNPRMVWEWYDYRRRIINSKSPNRGHRVLARWERDKLFKSFYIITQNVDGFHSLAGNENVLHLHGDIWKVRCTSCGKEEKNFEVPLSELPPKCECGGILRPGVVWFGESLPEMELEKSFSLLGGADVVFVIGTSGVVYPVASMPYYAKERGAKIVEINVVKTPITAYADYFFKGKAGEILSQIDGELSR